MRDWTDIKRASDFLAQSNIHLTWGPLRHILGHNIAIYHKNPDGVVVEFYCEMDQMYDEDSASSAAALAPGPAAAAEGLGRRHPVELVGTDVAQPEPHPSGAHRHRAGEKGPSPRPVSPRRR